MTDVRLVGYEFNIAMVEKDYQTGFGFSPSNKVAWIKAFRAVTGLGLKEGKETIEELERNPQNGADLNWMPTNVIDKLEYYGFAIKRIEESNSVDNVDLRIDLVDLVNKSITEKEYDLAKDLLDTMKKYGI